MIQLYSCQDVHNRTKVVPSNPLKADPTRTKMLRERFVREFTKRFRVLKGKILRLVVDENAFGLKQTQNEEQDGERRDFQGVTRHKQENGQADRVTNAEEGANSDGRMGRPSSENQKGEELNVPIRSLHSCDAGCCHDPADTSLTDSEQTGDDRGATRDNSGATSTNNSATSQDDAGLTEEKDDGTLSDSNTNLVDDSDDTRHSSVSNTPSLVKEDRGYNTNKKGKTLSGLTGNTGSGCTQNGSPETILTEEQGDERQFIVLANHIDFRVNKYGTDLPNKGIENRHNYITNQRWEALSTPQQVQAFEGWLKTQIEADIIEVAAGNIDNAHWTSYVEEGYRKGAGRAFNDVRKPALSTGAGVSDFFEGTRQEFLRQSFGSPVAIDKVKLLAGRVFTDLNGITQAMSTQISRVLVDGLVRGEGPAIIAKEITKKVEGIGVRRATTMARTEIVRAHAEGQLDAMERLGVEKVGVMVEWSTAGDDRVCPLCQPMEGVVFKLKEARGLIPRHPQCFIDPKTPILTDQGWVGISEIQVGTLVFTHMGRFQRVTQTHCNNVKEAFIVKLHIGDYSEKYLPLVVTEEHPVISRGEWIAIKKVLVGDTIKMVFQRETVPGMEIKTWQEEMSVSHVYLSVEKDITTYNLSVAEDESYIVAANLYPIQKMPLKGGGYIVHNCRCAHIPANVGEDKSDQKRGKLKAQSAIGKSIKAEIPKRSKRTIAQQKNRSPWKGADTKVAKNRPQSILDKAKKKE